METRYERGLKLLAEVVGLPAHRTKAKLDSFAPEAGIFLAEYFGDFYSRPQLDLKSREMVTITALAATGKLPQLKVHLQAALNTGSTAEEIKEIMMQLIPYTGFPTALNAIDTVHEFFNEKENE